MVLNYMLKRAPGKCIKGCDKCKGHFIWINDSEYISKDNYQLKGFREMIDAFISNCPSSNLKLKPCEPAPPVCRLHAL